MSHNLTRVTKPDWCHQTSGIVFSCFCFGPPSPVARNRTILCESRSVTLLSKELQLPDNQVRSVYFLPTMVRRPLVLCCVVLCFSLPWLFFYSGRFDGRSCVCVFFRRRCFFFWEGFFGGVRGGGRGEVGSVGGGVGGGG